MCGVETTIQMCGISKLRRYLKKTIENHGFIKTQKYLERWGLAYIFELYATLKRHLVHLQATRHSVQSLSWATAHCSTFARHTKPTAQSQPCKRAAIANTRQPVFSATDYRKLLINLQTTHCGQTI